MPDDVVGSIGKEILALDASAVTPFEVDRALRALLREIADDSAGSNRGRSTKRGSRPTQALTTQECEVLGNLLAAGDLETSAVVLFRLPVPVTTRILLSMRRATRTPIFDSVRNLVAPPEHVVERTMSRFIETVPPRPFPSLAKHLQQVVHANR